MEEWIESVNDDLLDPESLSDLFDQPIELAPELIKGMLRQGHKMLIAGPSKAGKSFSLIQLAIAIAEGRQWFGFDCAQGKVLYVNLELDDRSARVRFVDIYEKLDKVIVMYQILIFGIYVVRQAQWTSWHLS